jgi:hypothetical protein
MLPTAMPSNTVSCLHGVARKGSLLKFVQNAARDSPADSSAPNASFSLQYSEGEEAATGKFHSCACLMKDDAN